MEDYEQLANEFLSKTGTEFSAKFLKYGKHFEDDKEDRDIYEITLKRGERIFKFNFGQSIEASGKFICYPPEGMVRVQKPIIPYGDCKRNKKFSEPTPYEVFAALTKYMPDSFKSFCSDYGYDDDSIKAKKIYDAVVDEVKNLMMLYNDKEIEMLQEIN